MLSEEIYKSFLQTVVKSGVFSEDELAFEADHISDETLKAIKSKKRIDHRLPYLARISGKGGTDSNGVRYEEWHNVSMLEHATSVARGALVFAERDLLMADNDISEVELAVRLARITVVGFLHDADKMLGQARRMLDANDVHKLMERYKVEAFLIHWNASISADWMLAMIDEAEVSRAGRIVPGGVMLSMSDRSDACYVRCADRIEGKFLKEGPCTAIEELNTFHNFRAPKVWRDQWKILDIFQPHVPFLLEALQIGFANGCKEIANIPPLIEIYRDGRLIIVLPSEYFQEICDAALKEIARLFCPIPRVEVNHRFSIELRDARTTIETLESAVIDKPKLLAVTAKVLTDLEDIRSKIDDELGKYQIDILWPAPDKASGAYTVLNPKQEDDGHLSVFSNAKMLAVVLGHKTLAETTLNAHERENKLLELLDEYEVMVPNSIRVLDDKITRRTLISLIAASACKHEPDLEEALFGQAGFLEYLLDGKGSISGINASLPLDSSEQFVKPVRAMLYHAIDGQFVAGVEDYERRCHFTNMPVQEKARYKSKAEGIYALKVSAFSGREGRPESHRSSSIKGTYLSPLARAEHVLRFRANNMHDGKQTCFLLSSPSVSGLFASLILGSDTEITGISTFDLNTLDPSKVRVSFSAFDQFERRVLIGRYESHETKLADNLKMIWRIFEASLRTGRPIHVFQGAPYEVRDRVYFDALPHEVERGLGKKGFRIEELTAMRDKLRIWSEVSQVNGLGIAAAKAIMDPATRTAALCKAIDHIDRTEQRNTDLLRFKLLNQAHELIMNDTQASPIVRFARAMTGFQSSPHRKSSQSDRTRGMRLAIEALDSVSVFETTDRETMICAIIAEIENAAERETDKQYTARREDEPEHKEALTRAAGIFADEIWPDVFRRRVPDSKTRRSAISIYRVAFERAHQIRKSGEAVYPK
ncbi:MAG: hypothetical protein OXF20_06890 [Gammaproteobacteria bacterium]|nr:hypothetical protein [Gammaproteobacteria bacterium]